MFSFSPNVLEDSVYIRWTSDSRLLLAGSVLWVVPQGRWWIQEADPGGSGVFLWLVSKISIRTVRSDVGLGLIE